MSNHYLIAKKNYLEAAKIIVALQESDPELDSPNVRVEPQESLIEKAVQEIKSKIDPNYFKNVRSIVSGPMSGYGEVRSGGSEDPNVIHLNFQRIKSEVTNKVKAANPQATQQDIDNAIVAGIVETLTHEKGHIKGLGQGEIFAPESLAEQEAREMMQRYIPK